MKIQLDTTLKTVKLENSEKVGDLVDFLSKILPNDEWKTYKLEVTQVINWQPYPTIIVEPYKDPNPYPYYPNQPWITYGTNGTDSGLPSDDNLTYQVNPGVFNITSNEQG